MSACDVIELARQTVKNPDEDRTRVRLAAALLYAHGGCEALAWVLKRKVREHKDAENYADTDCQAAYNAGLFEGHTEAARRVTALAERVKQQ